MYVIINPTVVIDGNRIRTGAFEALGLAAEDVFVSAAWAEAAIRAAAAWEGYESLEAEVVGASREAIRDLLREAIETGDELQADLCRIALGEDDDRLPYTQAEAVRLCADAIEVIR